MPNLGPGESLTTGGYLLHDSHVGVLLEEATNHVAHLRLDYPERVDVSA